jgi:hypothetical protein
MGTPTSERESNVILYASSLIRIKTSDPVYHAKGSSTKTRCKRRMWSYYPAGSLEIARSYADCFARPCRKCFKAEDAG